LRVLRSVRVQGHDEGIGGGGGGMRAMGTSCLCARVLSLLHQNIMKFRHNEIVDISWQSDERIILFRLAATPSVYFCCCFRALCVSLERHVKITHSAREEVKRFLLHAASVPFFPIYSSSCGARGYIQRLIYCSFGVVLSLLHGARSPWNSCSHF
jgi:hypothetical protein